MPYLPGRYGNEYYEKQEEKAEAAKNVATSKANTVQSLVDQTNKNANAIKNISKNTAAPASNAATNQTATTQSQGGGAGGQNPAVPTLSADAFLAGQINRGNPLPGAANPTAANVDRRNVGTEETSAYHLDKLTSMDSPTMQRAAAQGRQMAHQRGLLNSSMAAEASQGAMVDRAQPFAINDANTYTKAASDNMAAMNQAYMQDAEASNQMKLQDYTTKAASAESAKDRQFNAQQEAMAREAQAQNLGTELAAKSKDVEKTQIAGILATYTGARGDIASADMKLSDKNSMLNSLDRQLKNDLALYTDLLNLDIPDEVISGVSPTNNTPEFNYNDWVNSGYGRAGYGGYNY